MDGGNMKVVCEKCESSFKFEAVRDMKCCPVCGEPFEMDLEDNSDQGKEPSFGDGIELGDDDSFDENKRSYWWYSIREPGTLDATDEGSANTICAKCGHFSFAPYPIAKSENYLLIDARYRGRCGGCGNEMKNHILSKCPTNWVDPRRSDMLKKDHENIPKCPVCSSTKIHKISMTNKAASALTFGIFAAGHVSKTYKCDICGSKF